VAGVVCPLVQVAGTDTNCSPGQGAPSHPVTHTLAVADMPLRHRLGLHMWVLVTRLWSQEAEGKYG
jgi:hypothetical protein